MIPDLCPRAGCHNVLGEDMQFRADMAEYQIKRARAHCMAGHTTYVGDVAPPLEERRPIPQRRAMKEKACKVCGNLFIAVQPHAIYCAQPKCKATARDVRDGKLRAKMASEGRNKSGWMKLSQNNLKAARAMGTSIRYRKDVPRPYVEPEEREDAWEGV